jgi:hypothetical protein
VRATQLFAQGVSTALNGGSGSEGALAGAVAAIAAGDARYRELVAAAPKGKGIAPLPASIWATNASAWAPAALAGFAAALSAAPGLRPVQAIRIVAVSVLPPALGVTQLPSTTLPGGAAATRTTQVPPPGSVTLLPPTSQVRPIVIIANRGNVAARGVDVVATLTRMISPPVVQTSHVRIGALGPYRSRYLLLPPFGTGPGRGYQLSVSAGIGQAAGPGLYYGQTASVVFHVAA